MRTVDAIYSNGLLRPVEPLPLREQERVRITVETDVPSPGSREEAIARLNEGFERTRVRTNGTLPTRDELHDRG